MLTATYEKRLLQACVTLACVVPLSAGLAGMLKGAAFLGGGGPDLDSHLRYLSGLLFAIGLGFLTAVPGIECRTGRFRLLTYLVFIGGAGRLLGFFMQGTPSLPMQLALIMELVVTPLLCIWQTRIARKLGILAGFFSPDKV